MIKLHTKRKKIQRTTKSFALEILLLIEETVCFRIMKKKPLVFFPHVKKHPEYLARFFQMEIEFLFPPSEREKKEECGNLILVFAFGQASHATLPNTFLCMESGIECLSQIHFKTRSPHELFKFCGWTSHGLLLRALCHGLIGSMSCPSNISFLFSTVIEWTRLSSRTCCIYA